MPPIAYFGIESSGLSLVIDLLILFLVVLYGSLVYWTYADARRRIVDPMLVGCATAASLFPFVGTLVYMILRPPEYLEDVRERELEMQAAEARLHELDYGLCPHCDYRIERDFIRCPSCLRKLKERCVNCSRPLDRGWTICPYCETEVPAVKPSRRAARREGSPATGSPSAAHRGLGGETLPVEAKPSSRARTAERAAVRAPETTSPASASSPKTSEPASEASEPPVRGGESTPRSSGRSRPAEPVTRAHRSEYPVEPAAGEDGKSQPAVKPSTRARNANRPRSTS